MEKREQEFAVLVEQVRGDFRLVAEGLTALDQKVDRGFRDVRQEMAVGFGDMRSAIAELARQLNEQKGRRRPTEERLQSCIV